MKTVSAVDARQHLGELLNVVSLRREEVLIERAGRKIARLVPHDAPTAAGDGRPAKLDFRAAAGLGRDVWKKTNAARHVERERRQWT